MMASETFLIGSDIRGKVPGDLNEETVARIALAFARFFDLRRMVVGCDIRLSSPSFAAKIIELLLRQGLEVADIGLCGTEELYHAVFSGSQRPNQGGIMITASHNPANYNGMKLVQGRARPVFKHNGLSEIVRLAADDEWYAAQLAAPVKESGRLEVVAEVARQAYLECLLDQIKVAELRPLRIVANSGNGCSGPVLDLLAERLPFEFIRLHSEPDGHFPNGVPNPLLPEKREDTAKAVVAYQADLGLAWDGDFDRCFFFDETGRFVDSYYIIGLLAQELLKTRPGAIVLHDPRLFWNTREMVLASGGVPLLTRTGHAFIKEKMRETKAIYGGEVSGHHYFLDFGGCDSGMLPWLLLCQLMSRGGQTLAALCEARMATYPVSGEINSMVADADAAIARVAAHYADGNKDFTDGLSISYPKFRFNLRRSNTEELLRLNVETRAEPALLAEVTEKLLTLIRD